MHNRLFTLKALIAGSNYDKPIRAMDLPHLLLDLHGMLLHVLKNGMALGIILALQLSYIRGRGHKTDAK